MKVVSSIRSKKVREKGTIVVKRKGRIYVINKLNRRMNCRQGGKKRSA